jgi:hypothetical protein
LGFICARPGAKCLMYTIMRFGINDGGRILVGHLIGLGQGFGYCYLEFK